MAVVNENVEETGGQDAAGHDFTAEIDGIKANFAQLRTDLNRLLSNAVGIGKSGAAEAVDGLKHRVSDLKEKGADCAQSIEDKIAENPVATVLLTFGVGFILAKLMTRK